MSLTDTQPRSGLQHLSASAQVFGSIQLISGFADAVDSYWRYIKDARNADNSREQRELAQAGADVQRDIILGVESGRAGYSSEDLRTAVKSIRTACAVKSIRTACVGSDPGAQNVMAAVIADTNANFSSVRRLGTQLLTVATRAMQCAATTMALQYAGDQRKLDAAKKDPIEPTDRPLVVSSTSPSADSSSPALSLAAGPSPSVSCAG